MELGSQLSGLLRSGDVVALEGPLGAGKTTLARGILRGLKFEGEVPSPTFNLVFEYPTDPPVLHADLFRLKSAFEAVELGLFEPEPKSLLIVEWPERAESLFPEGTIRIRITFEEAGRRVRTEVMS